MSSVSPISIAAYGMSTGMATISGTSVNIFSNINMSGNESASKRLVSEQSMKINEIKNILKIVLQTNIVPYIWGPPGIGKSTLVKAIAQENKYQLIDLRLSLLNPVDLRGLPVVNRDKKLVDWFSPSFLPNINDKSKGILFLDELNLAPLSVQAAAYQLILDKKVGEYKFPPTWKIVAAGNRENDMANVYKLSAPLANRFIHFTIGSDFEDWKAWAISKIVPEIISFLELRPECLLQMPTNNQKAFPSPRTWEFLSQLMDVQNVISKEIVKATVGDSVGYEFYEYLNSKDIQKLNKIIDEFIKTEKIIMPKKISFRDALIKTVIYKYNKKKITKKHLVLFRKQLSAEENKTIYNIYG